MLLRRKTVHPYAAPSAAHVYQYLQNYPEFAHKAEAAFRCAVCPKITGRDGGGVEDARFV